MHQYLSHHHAGWTMTTPSHESTCYRHPRWRHEMEPFSALLALYAGNSPVTGEFPSQRPVTRSVDVFFDLCLNKQLSEPSWGWWFGAPSRSLWRHCNANKHFSREVLGSTTRWFLCYWWVCLLTLITPYALYLLIACKHIRLVDLIGDHDMVEVASRKYIIIATKLIQ